MQISSDKDLTYEELLKAFNDNMNYLYEVYKKSSANFIKVSDENYKQHCDWLEGKDESKETN